MMMSIKSSVCVPLPDLPFACTSNAPRRCRSLQVSSHNSPQYQFMFTLFSSNSSIVRNQQSNNKMIKTTFLVFLVLGASLASEDVETVREVPLTDPQVGPCTSNSVVASWCDSSLEHRECILDEARNMYMCQCPGDPSACPEECILSGSSDSVEPVKTHHSILCHGIPQDEPNYILKTDSSLPLHHCENNGVVANWCNEATSADVDCLLLTALDEYVCTCRTNPASCPSECVEGSTLGRKTKHAVRCRGIPADSPNYIIE